MSTLISDTLKQINDNEFPIAMAEDIQMENGDSVEDAISDIPLFAVSDTAPTDEKVQLWLDNKGSIVYNDGIVADYNEYSTEEIVVGKWIDGKPIYRRVFNNLALTNRSGYYLPINDKVDKVVSYTAREFIGSTTWGNEFYGSSSDCIQLIVRSMDNKDTNNIEVYPILSMSSLTLKTLTVEYTKTTDTADSFDASKLARAVVTREASQEEVDDVLN